MQKYQDLWNDVLQNLASNLSEATFNEVFADVKKVVSEENGLISVLVPSKFLKTRINQLYARRINEMGEKLAGQKVKFKFICEDELENKQPKVIFTKFKSNNLNENFTFESFVVGESNRLGYITSMKAAESPGIFANPLYIFGGVGLGKTHMMQAIGNYISDSNIDSKILYVQAKDYISDYTKACQMNNMDAFEEKYSNLDVLLVDDIQMLEMGKKSQQEFFTLFNDMYNNQKQIVITSDCPANKLAGIMDRLTSRFQMGITVDIKQPDQSLRVNILKRKLEERSKFNLDEETLNFIAENFTDNVRELEGALNRVLLYAEVYNNNQAPSLAMTKEALEGMIGSKVPNTNSNYENALSVIASEYGITTADLLGSARNAKYVLPRHIAMYVLNTHYKLPYSKIGQILNGKDHTTIMHGCKKIESDLTVDKELKMAIDAILKKV